MRAREFLINWKIDMQIDILFVARVTWSYRYLINYAILLLNFWYSMLDCFISFIVFFIVSSTMESLMKLKKSINELGFYL